MMENSSRAEIEDRLRALHEAKEQIRKFHIHLKAHNWWLHDLQKEIAQQAFQFSRDEIWAQCGRSFGKSHLARYIAARFAIQNPNSACYIVAPERKQAYEIHWIAPDSNITNIIPQEMLMPGDEALNKSELRVNLKNGSFIKLDGADNVSALRGYKPHLFIADEFQAWKQDAWQAMEPNFIANKAIVVRIGTPPDRECYYTEQLKYFQKQQNTGNARYYFIRTPSSSNPRLDPIRLEELRRGFIERGEEAMWRREYLAEFVPGGAMAVFGTLWDRAKTVHPHSKLAKILEGDANQIQWYTICDPGTTSVFAVLFAAYNPYTAEIFLLDEIYERDRNKTSSTQIWKRVQEKEKELYPKAAPRTWRRFSDEAAAWFINEIAYSFREHLNKTRKAVHSKESMVSLAKDIMLHEKLRVSDRCKMFMFEVENYVTDEKGDIPDKDDHLLDCFFYLLSGSGYKFIERERVNSQRGAISVLGREGTSAIGSKTDWTGGLDERYFDA